MWTTRDRVIYAFRICGKYISSLINCKKSEKHKKKILLYANTNTMEEHLKNYLDAIGDDSEYQFYIFFGAGYSNRKLQTLEGTKLLGENIEVIHQEWRLYFQKWDLIVCADLQYPFMLKKGSIPLLHIEHGIPAISYDGGEHTYEYGEDCFDENGDFLFDVMLENDISVARAMWNEGKQFRNVIKFTGYGQTQKMEKEAEKKQYYKKQLGISDDKIVVSFFGSWNKESLFHVLGKDLFTECQKLEEKYMFIFSIHPNEYRKYDENIEPMGEMVEKQREHGFLVRSPKEDWLPYMMASDIVVGDYTTMTALAMIAEKKIIFSDFPDSRIWKKSLYYKAKHELPVICKAEQLESKLQEVMNCQKYDEVIMECKKNLYVSYDEYKKKIIWITKELLKA